MLLKILPGFIIAVGLGVVFSLQGESPDEVIAREQINRKWTVAVAMVQSDSMPAAITFQNVFPSHKKSVPINTEKMPDGKSTDFAGAASLSPSAAALRMLDIPEIMHDEIREENQIAEVASATAWREEATPECDVKSMNGLACMNGFCEEETSAWISTTRYPEPYIRGIQPWVSAKSYSDKQDDRGFHDANIYKHSGSVYSFGLQQDWSVDSVLGVSFDILDAQVKARYDYDYRKNDITGYFANAHYQGTLFGKYPVDMKATYGRLYHEGSGYFLDRENTLLKNSWNEGQHRSHYYAFSARAGLPLKTGAGIKMLWEIGLDYKQLRTTEYFVNPSMNNNPVDDELFAAMRSKSLQVPLTATFKRDFTHCWGLVTPKAMLGYRREFDDSASGVLALHSAAASRPYCDETKEQGKTLGPLVFNPSQKNFFEFGVGLDVRTVGGWNLTTAYNRVWAKEYSRDQFKLELSRCF